MSSKTLSLFVGPYEPVFGPGVSVRDSHTARQRIGRKPIGKTSVAAGTWATRARPHIVTRVRAHASRIRRGDRGLRLLDGPDRKRAYAFETPRSRDEQRRD